MKRTPNLFILILGIVLASFFLQHARADLILHPWENFYLGQATSRIQYQVSYFETTTNYTPNGNLFSPPGLREYQRIQNDLMTQWSLSESSLAFFRLSWAYLKQSGTTSPGQRWGLTDQSVGFNQNLFQSPSLRIDFQTQLDFPAYSDSSQHPSPRPALGDGSLDLSLGFFLEAPLLRYQSSNFSLLTGLGYTARNQGFSSALPITLGLSYSTPDQGIFAQLINYSFFSLKTDAHAKDPSHYRSNDRSGGSYLLQAMNPSLSQLQLRVGYEWSSSKKIWISATQSIWGQMSPENHQFHLNISLPLNTPTTKIVNNSTPNTRVFETSSTPHSEVTKISDPHPPVLRDAQVLNSHDRLNLIKINQGNIDGVQIGQLYQIYSPVLDPKLKQPIAQGKVSHTKPHESVIEVVEFFHETWIEKGFLARPIPQ